MTDIHELPAQAALISAPKLLLRGLVRRCPVCGHGGLFKGWLKLKPHCPTCGFDFDREPGWWIGAMTMNTALMMGVFLIFLVVGLATTWPDVPWNALTIITFTSVAASAVFFYPISKTLWLAVDILLHRMDAGLR